MSYLYVIQGHNQGCRFELKDKVVSIGRDASNLFQLQDSEVSRRHAEIRFINGKLLLIDNESSNGSYVNGYRVKKAQLHSGDQIQLGNSLLLFSRYEDDESYSHEKKVLIEFTDDFQHIVESIPQDDGTWLFDGSFDPNYRVELGGLPDSEKSVPGDGDKDFSRMRGHVKMMYHTSLVVSQTLDISRLLNRIIGLIFDWVQVDHVCVLLYNSDGKLVPQVFRIRDLSDAKNEKTETPHSSLKINQTILEFVLQKGEGVLTNGTANGITNSTANSTANGTANDAKIDVNGRWNPDSCETKDTFHETIHEAICVPMRGRYGIIGVMYLGISAKTGVRLQVPYRLTRDHLKLMGAIAHQTALAVEDTRYYRGMVHAERLAAVGQTVTVLSHDIKNILQGITGGSYLIEKGLAQHNEAQIAKGWKIVHKNQNKISELVLDMLNFTAEREPKLSSGNINNLIREVVELMQGRCQEPLVHLAYELDELIPLFCYDEQQISRAITNVITNAIDAASERTKNLCDCEDSCVDRKKHEPDVKVTTVMDEKLNRVSIIVDDNGHGVNLAELDQIFRPFFSSKKSSGTGLGLAITQKIIQEHNGMVRIDNSPLGGARFVLDIPILLLDRDEKV